MRHAFRNSGSGLARRMLDAAAVVGALTMTAQAQWMVVSLHPAGATSSQARGVYGDQQVGNAAVDGVGRASLWTGLAALWVDLSPAGATSSAAWGVYDGQQVGYAVVGGVTHAGLWTGSAASWVDLNPAGAGASYAYGVYGGQQVGAATVDGVTHAGLWTGSAASWVDLHAFLPSDFTSSEAHGIWSDGILTYVVGYGYNGATSRTEAQIWVECRSPGDLNDDGVIDGLDIQPFVNCVLQGPGGLDCLCGDLTGDGLVTIDDIQPFVTLLIGP